MAKRRKPPKKEKADKPPPTCKAIILAERTIIERATNNISIIGIFDSFTLASFPGMTGPAVAFLQLVDGIGRYNVMVEIHDLQDNMVVARAADVNIDFAERLHKVNLMINIPPLPLQHAGTYDVVVLANGQEIDRQQFIAQAKHQGG